MAIPKKIHWCWLSGEPLPKHLQKCVNSWKKNMPDYEIILWDKNRFDIHSVKFVEDACAERKWACAADYIRLYALYTEGGIYLDSDVMVFRRFDNFLNLSAFSAIEYFYESVLSRNENNKFSGYAIQAAIIGAEKGNEWIGKCLNYYQYEKVFKMKNGQVDFDVLPNDLARYAHIYYNFQYDLPLDSTQFLKDNIVIYPPKVFSYTFGDTNMYTYAIHIGEISWFGEKSSKTLKSCFNIKSWYRELCYSYRFLNMLHWKRKSFFRKFKK